ncbi:phosphatase [Pseudaeromonas sp. ZJS20]|uniref:phosphatase n=1 Tax=Pseudaeromonas aegiceratis TaxID=3153928 RepID=UPI00390CB707
MPFLVDVHSHTVASTHAYSTLHDYLAEARHKGIRLFATTDHGPAMADAPHPWHFINLKVVPRLVDGIGILRGMEANIKNLFGETDCDERLRGCLDIVLAGFHQPVFPPSSQEEHTRAMINTMRGGMVDIISHPGNPSFPIDMEAVVAAAVKFNVALEINNSSFLHSRVGSESNCRRIAELARDLGATLVLGSDAHIAFDLGNHVQGEALLAEVGFPVERLLNRSPRALLDFLESRGRPPIAELASL